MTNESTCPQARAKCQALLAPTILICTIILGGFSNPQEQKAQNKTAQADASPRFDNVVREDFFAGLSGDKERFERAMALCEAKLAKNPQDPEAMVWHGAGVYFRGGQAIAAGDYANGKAEVVRGSREMNNAVELHEGLETLIPRGAVLLNAAQHMSPNDYRTTALRAGVADYEKVLQIDRNKFSSRTEHGRGELLAGLADAYLRLGEQEKAATYLERIKRELPESKYAAAAAQVLASPSNVGQVRLTCLGCHFGATQTRPANAQPSVQETNDAFVQKISKEIVGHEQELADKVFKNIQILKTTPAGRLLLIMNLGYARALGVTCTHCHVEQDFSSDDKRPKRAAREMAAMHRLINEQLAKMQNLEPRPQGLFINCSTCHRGAVDPMASDR